MSAESVWAQGDGLGTGYHRRMQKDDGTWDAWEFFSWNFVHLNRPTNRAEAEVWIAGKNKFHGAQYALVQCGKCHIFHNQFDWVGALCTYCAGEKSVKTNPLKIVRKVGEVWELNPANAPFNSRQWGYQGTAKEPYVVTHYFARVDGSTTGDGWACSCMSFTRNVPRTPCKHILHVMLQNGVVPKGVSVKAAKVTSVLTDDDAAQFEKWKREQAEKKDIKPTAGNELALFGSTGRKFR